MQDDPQLLDVASSFNLAQVLGVAGGAWGFGLSAPGFLGLLAASLQGGTDALQQALFAVAFLGPGVVGGLLGIAGGLVSKTKQRTGGKILLAAGILGICPVLIILYDLSLIGSSLPISLLLTTGLVALIPFSWTVPVVVGGIVAVRRARYVST